MRWILMIPALLAAALLSMTAPALAGAFEFPRLDNPVTVAPARVGIASTPVVPGQSRLPQVFDDHPVLQ